MSDDEWAPTTDPRVEKIARALAEDDHIDPDMSAASWRHEYNGVPRLIPIRKDEIGPAWWFYVRKAQLVIELAKATA